MPITKRGVAGRQIRLAAATATLAAAIAATPAPVSAATKTWDLNSAGSNNGQIDNGSGLFFPLTEHWNGTAWSVVPDVGLSRRQAARTLSISQRRREQSDHPLAPRTPPGSVGGRSRP